MKEFFIGGKKIGDKNPCFIIAEAGINHNGDIKLAKKLIDVAKESGADAVKFQTVKAENIVTETLEVVEYQKKNIGKKETQLEMIKKFELDYNTFIDLKKYCDKKQIIFLSTPHSEDAIDFLEPLVPAYKVASGDLTNLPFLEKIAKKRKLIILSTGMANLKEVKEAVKTIKRCGNNKIILLHCTTNYPCLLNEVNLKAMVTLKKEFDLPVGYSDHTEGIIVPIIAVSLGAWILEKHFTLDKNLPGPDHRASLEPEELKEMVKVIRKTEIVLGSLVKKPTKSEHKIKRIIRKSIIAKINIARNSVIEKDMVEIKRPDEGIPPKYFKKIIGRVSSKNIKKDQPLKWSML